MSEAEAGQRLTIGGLASACGVGLGTIHYYQRLGLLQKPGKPKNGGFRSYSQSDVKRLLLIKNAQTLGLSLKEIGTILALHQNGECAAIKSLLSDKTAAIKSEIQALKESLKQLSCIADCCNGNCAEGKCLLFLTLSADSLEEAP